MTQLPVFGFAGYVTVPPPRDGFWRVSSWPRVFDPPPAPPPLGTPPDKDDGHRYDDPEGKFRTLYCATEPEGAVGECLGDFVFNTVAVARIEAFLESEPEPGFDEGYHRPLRPEDIEAFDWKLAHAPAHDAQLIDVEHPRTYTPPRHALCPRSAVTASNASIVRRYSTSVGTSHAPWQVPIVPTPPTSTASCWHRGCGSPVGCRPPGSAGHCGSRCHSMSLMLRQRM